MLGINGCIFFGVDIYWAKLTVSKGGKLKKFIAICLLVMTASSAFAGQCFRKNSVKSWHVDHHDSRRIFINEYDHSEYLVTTYRVCNDLQVAAHIRFRTPWNRQSWVCQGDDVMVLDRNYPRRVSQMCNISSVERLH